MESEKRTTSIYWPVVVDVRLGNLLAALEMAGHPVSAAQLLGALVWEASDDVEILTRLVVSYRRAVLEDPVVAPIRSPGARSRTKRSPSSSNT